MKTKKLLVGTLVGGLVMWLLGLLIWRGLLADFFAANAGAATDLVRDTPIYWAGILGTLALAALVTLAI